MGFQDFFRVAWLPATIVGIIAYTTTIFVLETLIPQFHHAMSGSFDQNEPLNFSSSMTNFIVEASAWGFLMLMFLISGLRAAITPPGKVPETEMWTQGKFGISRVDEERLFNIINDFSFTGPKLLAEKPFLKSLPVVERKMKNKGMKARYCEKCSTYKPDRTHHCSICNHCVLRMDHHCPWILNCVGFGNYKFFLLLLIYSVLNASFVVIFMFFRFLRAFRPIMDAQTFFAHDLQVIIVYSLCLFIVILLGMFTSMHFSLVVNCMTTIELREKRDSKDPSVKHRWEVSNTKFAQDTPFQNWLHVFGSPYLWFLPIQSDLLFTDGTYSETRPAKLEV